MITSAFEKFSMRNAIKNPAARDHIGADRWIAVRTIGNNDFGLRTIFRDFPATQSYQFGQCSAFAISRYINGSNVWENVHFVVFAAKCLSFHATNLRKRSGKNALQVLFNVPDELLCLPVRPLRTISSRTTLPAASHLRPAIFQSNHRWESRGHEWCHASNWQFVDFPMWRRGSCDRSRHFQFGICPTRQQPICGNYKCHELFSKCNR